MPLTLVMGNKKSSSWSMRPWVLMREAGIAFEALQLWFDDEARPQGMDRYSPTAELISVQARYLPVTGHRLPVTR
jgi:glutathione S-transferase